MAMTIRDYHYLTDAVGGFCLAVVVVLGLAMLLDRFHKRDKTRAAHLAVEKRRSSGAIRPVARRHWRRMGDDAEWRLS